MRLLETSKPSRRWWASVAVAVLALSAWWVMGRLRTPPGAHATEGVQGAREHVASDASLRVAHAEPASLSGSVRTADGAPVRGARVCASGVGSEAVGAPHVTCTDADAKGHYAIGPVAAGGYEVTAEADGFAPGSAHDGAVFLSSGEERPGLDIVLQPGGAKLAGLVLDATGGPVPGARVRATRVSPPFRAVEATSHGDGKFTLSVIPGPVVLTAEAIGYAPARAFHVAPSADVVLTLTPGSSISGDVISGQDGKSVPDITVRAIPRGAWASPVFHGGLSNAEGAFAVSGLEPNAYELVAEGDGWRGQSTEPIELGLAQTVDHVTLRVFPALRVAGRVVLQSTGNPCREGSVTLGPTAPGMTSPYDPPTEPTDTRISAVPSMVAPIEPGGDVRFRSVPSGTYHVVVQCSGQLLADGPATLKLDQSDLTDFVWKVAPGLSMTVHLVDDSNRPLPSGRFLLLWPARKQGAARPTMVLTADADGVYSVPGALYAGTYSLRPEGGQEGAPVDVELRREWTRSMRPCGSVAAARSW